MGTGGCGGAHVLVKHKDTWDSTDRVEFEGEKN